MIPQLNATWQNFSSLYREYVCALEAPNAMSRDHHLTASLYFGIAAIEAFLNERMRAHLAGSMTPEEIVRLLRKTPILEKIRKWPDEVVGKPSTVSAQAVQKLQLFNDVRGDVTHPKGPSRDIYERLGRINAEQVYLAVAEYLVCCYQGSQQVFPYWLLGWNYLNPTSSHHEVIEIHEQQFCFSMQYMGAKLRAADPEEAHRWQTSFMTSFSGFEKIRSFLSSAGHCQPKHPRFPYAPILCARWWEPEHHKTCGHVTREAIIAAQ